MIEDKLRDVNVVGDKWTKITCAKGVQKDWPLSLTNVSSKNENFSSEVPIQSKPSHIQPLVNADNIPEALGNYDIDKPSPSQTGHTADTIIDELFAANVLVRICCSGDGSNVSSCLTANVGNTALIIHSCQDRNNTTENLNTAVRRGSTSKRVDSDNDPNYRSGNMIQSSCVSVNCRFLMILDFPHFLTYYVNSRNREDFLRWHKNHFDGKAQYSFAPKQDFSEQNSIALREENFLSYIETFMAFHGSVSLRDVRHNVIPEMGYHIVDFRLNVTNILSIGDYLANNSHVETVKSLVDVMDVSKLIPEEIQEMEELEKSERSSNQKYVMNDMIYCRVVICDSTIGIISLTLARKLKSCVQYEKSHITRRKIKVKRDL